MKEASKTCRTPQAFQYIHNGSLRDEKGEERKLKEIVDENFQNFQIFQI